MKSVACAVLSAGLLCIDCGLVFSQTGRPRIPAAVRGQSPHCVPAPSCTPPPCAPGYVQLESVPSEPETAPQPEGAYVRGPEGGEFAGESTSFGVRGFGLRLPAISIEMPEVRMHSLVRYRRNAEMHVESSRAPWVAGRPAEFRQVNRGEAAVVPERGPGKAKNEIESGAGRSGQPYCAPPPVPPCSANEQRLQDELAQKEVQLREMQDRFAQLESAVQQLVVPESESANPAPAELPSAEFPGVTQSSYEVRSNRKSSVHYSGATRGRMAASAGKVQSSALQSAGISGQLSRMGQ